MEDSSLKVWYLVCQIWMLLVWGTCIIPVISMIYLTWFLFIPTIVAAVFAFFIARRLGQKKTKVFDTINIFVSGLRLIPFVGWVAGIGGIVMCVLNLVFKNK